MMKKVHIKKNDQVVVISGPKDGDKAIQGKQGKVLTVFPKTGKVIVEGVAFVTKHMKARHQGQQGGIFQKERAIDASNVMLVCPKCNKPTRVSRRKEEIVREDGTKKTKTIRVCKKCGADID